MTPTRAARLRAFLFAAPLALVAASCGEQSAEGGAPARGEPVAAVPAPAGTQWSDQVIRTAQGGYLVGNPAAPIKLVEYASLTCPACAAFSQNGHDALTQEYINSGRVSFELRSFMIHGTPDLVLTRLIECGGLQGTHPLSHEVWKNLDAISGNFQAAGPQLEAAMQLPQEQRFVAFAERSGLLEFFASRGLSETTARQCLADYPAMERLANASAAYGEDGVSGTPTFELNGARVNANGWDAIERALQEAGAR